MLELTLLDFITLTIVLVSGAFALVRGFTREILSIVSWAVAIYGALLLAPALQPLLALLVGVAADNLFIANASLVLTFLALIVTALIIANRFSSRMQASSIGALDHTLGLIFGGVRGLLIAFFGYFGILMLVPEDNHPDWITQARLRPVLQTGTAGLIAILPLERLPIDVSRLESLLKSSKSTIRTHTARAITHELETLEEFLPTVETPNPDAKGYKANERVLMERLIENTRGLE